MIICLKQKGNMQSFVCDIEWLHVLLVGHSTVLHAIVQQNKGSTQACDPDEASGTAL